MCEIKKWADLDFFFVSAKVGEMRDGGVRVVLNLCCKRVEKEARGHYGIHGLRGGPEKVESWQGEKERHRGLLGETSLCVKSLSTVGSSRK